LRTEEDETINEAYEREKTERRSGEMGDDITTSCQYKLKYGHFALWPNHKD